MIIKFLKYLKAKKQFRKNSFFGVNFHFDYKSRCFSESKNNIVIGNNSEVFGTLISQENGKISIGDHSTIRFDSIVGCVNAVSIGDNVIISNNVHIYDNNNHPTNPEVRKKMTDKGFYGEEWKWKNSVSKPIIICNNVWIGERATILKGVTIGEGSIIGCDSVVTKDVPPFSVAAGNPAVVLKQLIDSRGDKND